jgi:hypothetical protein
MRGAGEKWRGKAYGMSFAQRLDVHERKDFVVLEEFERGDLAWMV